ncbi:MAG: glycosyltransferase [Pararobbsia sp.]
MKIIHLANHVLECGNGIVNVMVDLACGQADAGHEVVVASSGGQYETLLAAHGVRHLRLVQEPRPERLLAMCWRLGRMVRAERPDIVHAHMMTGVLIARVVRGIGPGATYRLVSTVHNEFQRSATVMGIADRVVAVSTAVAASMRRRGVSDTRLRTIPNGTINSPRTAVSRRAPPDAVTTTRGKLAHPAASVQAVRPAAPSAAVQSVGSGVLSAALQTAGSAAPSVVARAVGSAVPSAVVQAVGSAVPAETAQAARSVAPSAAGAAARLKRPNVMTVAGMYRRKGIDVLLRAFALVAGGQVTNAHLYIVGEGPDREEFETLSHELGLDDCTHFLGFRADVPALLAACDVFVLPSLQEPFGLVISEAREAGCAVVASDVGGIPEAMDFGQAGLLVPPGDHEALGGVLNDLLADEALRESWRARARLDLDWLKVERVNADYLALYEEVLGRPALPAMAASGAR